ncbi:Glucan endo-1,3-alpha-glucosidase agn1 [Colletotrichum sp. SAR 10_86]|nr:Glucan endo-1,3-alpha-glucosidase agn1 [Colletotrichum sp. SAR 10_65]KAI8201538.1 Glucan endo-1,3-alpha-glucosidase agn1 [Colletotrichum sp. SAR 10_76]KAI8220988.1 Glucan endo-1,3-alpha-glucosidase agn1 [Colletotrichum sp. SAR 10_86]KAI8222725.1 Glucan endo-1,3-alpha-glucosidase agn1 [Colletotrichum sp. SAR 10_77]
MRLLLFFLTSLSWVNEVLGRAVFAHFMVGNTEHYTASDWVDDIKLAQEAHIDAFALNMAKGEPMNTKAIADAFSNAEALGFKLFFSFDYAGRGPFSKDEVISWINKYASSSAYFRHQGKPFVSTFEGPDQAEDWVDIKATTGCFFVPDWSSLGAGPAVEKAGGVVDGLFSWAGWPWGDQDMDTYVDASYRRALNGKAYMMPVSPWFYTNLPGYSKNWLWRGDHLWFDRWIQVNTLMPEFVQIISWNDYGESHHIGPIRDHALVAFDTGKAPYRYSLDHHGWRVLLPFAIDRYKNNKATITSEGVSFWYRTTPKDACGTGGTTGNTVSQLQMEFQPNDIIQDSVFFTVLSTDTVSVTVSIGGVSSKGVLRDLPDGGAGLYHGSAPFNGRTGDVRVTVTRKSVTIADETGPAIKNDCHNGMTGFDAWAGGGLTSRAPSAVDTPSLENEVCIRGTGANDFDVLCRTTCYWGYCPESACVCRATGAQIKLPPETPGEVHPAEGLNSNYIGLCNYACLYGACFSTYCGKDEYPLIEPTVEMPHLDKDCYRFTDSEKCAGDETQVAQASELEGKCGLGTLTNRYCCKNNPPPFSNCHWVGQGDCADNTCNNKEVTLILDQGGGDGNLCSWWRKKSLCCTPEEAVFGNGVCPNPYCTILIGDCALDEWAEDDDTDEDTCDDHDELRRDEGALAQYDALSLLTLEDGSLLGKRAKRRRTYQAVIEDIIQNLIEIIIIARAYPGSGTLHSNTRGDPASDDIFELAPGCGNVDVIVKDRKTFTKKQISAAYDTEHNPDLQFMADFLHTLGTGELPDLSRTVNGFIDPNDIEYWWDAPFPFGTFPTQGTSRCINSINDFIMDFFGSQGNRKPLLLCERRLNQMKGRIFNREMRPVNDVVMAGLRDDALSGDTQAEETMFDNIARAIGVWNYLNHPDALPTVSTNRNNLIDGSGLIGRLVPAFARMRDILMEFDENWYNDAAERTRGWVDEMLDLILQDLDALSQAGRAPPNEFSIRARVARLLNRRGDIKPPKR